MTTSRSGHEYERAHRAAQTAETWAVVDEAGAIHEGDVSEGRTGAPPWVAHRARYRAGRAGGGPMTTSKAFPTPASVQSRVNEASAARVAVVVAALAAAVEREGATRINVSARYDYRDRDAIRAAVEPAGWSVEFCDDQREGQSITLTPKGGTR